MCKAKCYQTRPSLCVFYVILLYHITHTTAEKCRKLSACSCECDGNIIDLKDLSNKAGEDPR